MTLERIYDDAEITGVSADGVTPSELDDALDYYDGYADKDRTVLESALIKRYATRLKKGDPDVDGNDLEEYIAADVKDNIEKGRTELVLTRFYRRLVNSSATLFTEETGRYSYVDDSGNDAEDAESDINKQREAGDYERSTVRADRLSVALGSSVLYVYYQDGLRYQAIAPQCVTPLYSPEIIDGDSARLTDTVNPDEATGWVIRLGRAPGDDSSSVYVAYLGASDRYPMGRCVMYTGSSPDEVPEVGTEEAHDHLVGDEVANPLTAVKQSLPEDQAKLIPEYPISIFVGSDAGVDDSLLPTTGLSLFRDSLEIDMGWSRLALTALKSARGVTHLSDEHGAPLPGNPDEGIVVTRRGQDLNVTGVAAVNSKDASEVIHSIQGSIAEAWNVPAHEVVAGTAAPESGVALFLRNQPRIKFRSERERLNKQAVDRIFQIERALLYAEDGQEVIPWAISQNWTSGEYQIPITDKERIEGLKLALDSGLIDRAEFVRQYHRLPTIDEAIDLIKNMSERSAGLPQIQGSQQSAPSARQAAIQRLRGQ